MSTGITIMRLPAAIVAIILLVSPMMSPIAPTPNDFFQKQINQDKLITVIEDDVATDIVRDLPVYVKENGDWEDAVIDYQIRGKIFEIINEILMNHKFGAEIRQNPNFSNAEYQFINKLVINKDRVKTEAEKRIGEKFTVIKRPNVSEIYVGNGKARLWDMIDHILPIK